MIAEIENEGMSWFFGNWLTELEQREYLTLMERWPKTHNILNRMTELEDLCRNRCLLTTTVEERSARGYRHE